MLTVSTVSVQLDSGLARRGKCCPRESQPCVCSDTQHALQAASSCALMRLHSDVRPRAERRATKLGYLKVNLVSERDIRTGLDEGS